MKIIAISDTHGRHDKLIMPKGDVLIHAGDFTPRGEIIDVAKFSDFLAKQNYQYKIVIAGNHDFSFEDERQKEVEKMITDAGAIYLNDSGIEIAGVKFWGSPITPWFHDWAFNRARGIVIKKHWDLIPGNTDVLITHGPPYGILDRVFDGQVVGCEELLIKVQEIKPRLHIFGHIHEDRGIKEIAGTLFMNASSIDVHYKKTFEPMEYAYLWRN
jgi:Icc-related predicted phosphoesterase